MSYQRAAQITETNSVKNNQTTTKPEKNNQQQTAVSTATAVSSNPLSPPNDLNQLTNGRLSHAGNTLLQLQNQYGNRYVQQLINPTQRLTVQPKLLLGNVDTPSEREADQIATQMTGNGQITSASTAVTGPTLPVSPETERTINQAKGSGQSLPENICSEMEQSLGIDLSGVRVHTDSRADNLNQTLQAQAFTTGQDIFFRQGGYNPSSASGQNLLAHELTHVAQQNQESSQIQRRIAVKDNDKVSYFSSESLSHLLMLLSDGSNKKTLFQTLGIANTFLHILDNMGLKHTDYEKPKTEEYVWELNVLRNKIETMVQNLKPKLLDLKEKLPSKTFYKIYYQEIQNAVPGASGEWQPIKMGKKFIKGAYSEPNEKITKKIILNDEIDEYIPQEEQKRILDYIAKTHGTGAVTPRYWTEDEVSDSARFEEITYSGLRPVIGATSFAKGSKKSEKVYRGSSLNPAKIMQYGHFRAWGIDDDLYYHTFQNQTDRQQSAYVSTSSDKAIAVKFAGAEGYVYKINLDNLFHIDIRHLSSYGRDENEVVVPYKIPYKNIESVEFNWTHKIYGLPQIWDTDEVYMGKLNLLYEGMQADWAATRKELDLNNKGTENAFNKFAQDIDEKTQLDELAQQLTFWEQEHIAAQEEKKKGIGNDDILILQAVQDAGQLEILKKHVRENQPKKLQSPMRKALLKLKEQGNEAVNVQISLYGEIETKLMPTDKASTQELREVLVKWWVDYYYPTHFAQED